MKKLYFYDLDHLRIVGFNDILSEHSHPCVVSPIFKHSVSGDYITPPLDIIDGVVEGVILDKTEFKRFEDQFTMLDKSIKPKIDHELWIDDLGEIRYDSFDIIEKEYELIYEVYLEKTKKALLKGDLREADSLSLKVYKVKPQDVNSIALRSVINDLDGCPYPALFNHLLKLNNIDRGDFNVVCGELKELYYDQSNG